jgi:hypothetical protein
MATGTTGLLRGWRLSAWVAVLVLGGLWGCSRGPSSGQAERIRAMESRIEQLVSDFQVVAEARDQARERITALEEQVATLTAVTRERDQLREHVAKLEHERDIANTRCERLRKGFLNLLTEDDTLAAERVLPATKVPKGQVPAVAASGSGELPQE